MRRRRRNADELEAKLRAGRPKPRQEFLTDLANRVEQRRRPTRRLRPALATAFTATLLGVFAAVGGIGYATSATHALVSGLTSSHGNGATVDRGDRGNRDADNSPADDQYVGKTTICHHTHSAKNPWVVITVSNNALPAHRAHGDTLVGPGGTCPGPAIP